MTVKEPPDSQGSEAESSKLDSDEQFTTQTIDLDKLYAGVVTDSGSFDLRQLERASVFKLLDALPTPAFLIDQSHAITFMNVSCGKISPRYYTLKGQPFSSIYATPDEVLKGRSLLEKVFVQRKPLVAKALVGIEGSLIWARIHWHSLRMSEGRAVLALIEDLTSEKRQALFEEKHRRGLEESHGQLEQRVTERTGELVRSNERLQEEILVRQKTEESLARELTKFQALYDLAVAMTADRSLDDNLSLVVEKSRELLLGDTSYIALRDEAAGDIYMHTLLGINTEAFRRLRIPFSVGLGGKVATTGVGCIVEDYFKEIEPLLHDTVESEGVISGVAVPIQIGQTNLGVLYVFNRTKTKFSKSDLDTLSLLGNLAAVEIARKRSAEELSKAHEELEQRVEERTSEVRRTNARLFREIGERKRSEEALLRSETKYRNILETIADGYHEVDLAGNMLLVNDSLCDIFGYPREEVLRLNYRQLLDSDMVRHVYAAYNQVYKTGQPNPGFAFEIKRKDSTKRNVSVSISLIRDSSNKPIGFRGIFRDITERRRLEEQLRQAAKMEAIGRLAGGVAHDFNNLLTAVIGYSHLIMQQVAEKSAIHEKLTQITRAAERAAELTGQLLAFSRKQVLEVKVLNLNDVIGGLEGMLRRIIGEDIQLVTVFQPSLGSVRVDPVQMEQILMNLVINSRDAMPAGGILKMETANVFLDEAYCHSHGEVEVGPYVTITVSDTGHGMDADTLHRIFDPFFTTKEKGVGTGLGLSTVYGIIRQHQGHITVNSTRGRGATFRVFFPRVDAMPEKDSRAKSTGPHHYGTETILVVEDEQIVRDLACEALAMLGYSPLSARDPDQAISICDAHKGPIHLLVSDLVLPQMDGSSLFKKLSPRRPEMKVLFVSGYTENFIVHQGILDRGVNFLAKPFTVESLAKKVREVLDASS